MTKELALRYIKDYSDTNVTIWDACDKQVAIPERVKPYGEDFTAYMCMDVVTGEYYGKNMDAIFDADESIAIPYIVYVLNEIDTGRISADMKLENDVTIAKGLEQIYLGSDGYADSYKAMLKVAPKESFIKWAQEKGYTVTMKDEVPTGTANLLFFKDCFREYYIKKNSTELRKHLWSLSTVMPNLPGYVATAIACSTSTIKNEQCLDSNGTRAFFHGFVIDYSNSGKKSCWAKNNYLSFTDEYSSRYKNIKK